MKLIDNKQGVEQKASQWNYCVQPSRTLALVHVWTLNSKKESNYNKGVLFSYPCFCGVRTYSKR